MLTQQSAFISPPDEPTEVEKLSAEPTDGRSGLITLSALQWRLTFQIRWPVLALRRGMMGMMKLKLGISRRLTALRMERKRTFTHNNGARVRPGWLFTTISAYSIALMSSWEFNRLTGGNREIVLVFWQGKMPVHWLQLGTYENLLLFCILKWWALTFVYWQVLTWCFLRYRVNYLFMSDQYVLWGDWTLACYSYSYILIKWLFVHVVGDI